MFLPNWRKGLSSRFTNRAMRRRAQKRAARVQILEARSLLSVTPTGATIAPIETVAFTGTVASFTATDAGPFTATVDWGDGTTDAGTVTPSGGGFNVDGTHTYAEDGSEALSVVIVDAADATTATALGVANVSEVLFTLSSGSTINATEGQAVTGFQVATFSDPGSTDPTSDFSATISWGDGVTTAGTITGSAGNYTVTGDHTYADELSATYLVTVFEPEGDLTIGPLGNSVNVADADALAPDSTPITLTGTEGFAVSGAVASFTDTGYPGNVPADFTATIDWGDGTTDAGTVSGSAGSFTVSGSHTYAEDGTYSAIVVISDDAPGTASATATAAVQISEGSFALSSGGTLNATENQAVVGFQVATFSDPGSTDLASDFSATINWGDGTITAGTITGSAGNFTVTGDHTYADELSGSYLVTVSEAEANFTTGPVGNSVNVAEADALTAGAITSGGVQEGLSYGGIAAIFIDSGYPTNDPADFTASFDWGDGATYSTGAGNVTVTSDGAGDFTLSVAAHTYVDEGVFTVVATLADNAPGTASLSQTGTLTALESDAFTPAATPVTLTATEGTAVSGAVATFTDTGYPSNSASDFSATIDWGDGTISAGTVSGGSGVFTVGGTHIYAEDGAYTATAVISDDAPGTATGTATATVQISESDFILASGGVLNATEGQALVGFQVATFSDPGSTDPASDFSATIAWGDGATTAGTITGSAGNYTVTGDHTYADEFSGSYLVTVTEPEGNLTIGPVGSSVNVAEADVLVGTGTPIATAEGVLFSGTAAIFSDTGFPGNVAGDFSSTIDWGDGTTTPGTVSGGSGAFTVSGNHLYADEGSYAVTVVLSDDAPGTATGTAATTAAVADNDTLVSGPNITASSTEGALFSGTVAAFTDTTYAGNLPADFTATIDWGDGTVTAGTVGGSAGSFTVAGSHVYGEEGVMTATVTLADDAPGTATGTAATTINVADAPLSAAGVTIAPTEGLSFSGVVANFTDADPAGTVADYTATIVWGDGATTAGTVTAAGGGFQVSGAHIYAEEGTDSITVTIADVGGSTATANSTANVGDAALTASATTVTPTEGASFTGIVATFVDANPGATVSDFTATITWGDGATTAGTVTANGGGGFDVTGTHTYLEEGLNPVQVVVQDVGGSTATAASAANVADAPLSATGTTVTSPEFTTFTGVVATFTDADPNGTVSDYTATIDWGDGTTTAGVVAAAGGGFNVSGSHAYTEDGTFTVKATIVDAGGSTATATGAADITEPSISGTGVALNGFERSPLTNVVVATFLHGNGGEPASGFTAVIDWGDGVTSPGTITETGTTYTVTGSHVYMDEGITPIKVTVSDDTASATIASSAKMAEELLPNGTVGTPNERFIQEVYRDLLHRQVDTTALPYWSNLLDQGQSRVHVVQTLIAAAMPGELGADLVTGIFEKYLGRDPDAVGLAFWVGIISTHETIEQTEANVAGTAEFYQLSGGTSSGFITRLFNLALGRAPDANALSGFGAALSAGMTREQVAEIVFNSHEYHLREVAGYYQSAVDPNDRFTGTVPFIDDLDFLDRQPDPAGQAAFAADLDTGALDQQVWALMMASDEFFAKIA